MKQIYLLLFACLVASTSIAQTGSGTRFGIKAGVNFSRYSVSGDNLDDEDKDAMKSQTSFQIGGLADISLGTSFSVQPGLTLSGKGNKEEYAEEGHSYESKRNVMYLEIPVNVVYKIGGIYLGAGPYAAFALSGKDKSVDKEDGEETEEEEYKLKFGSDPKKHDLKRGDFGVNLLAGYRLSNGLNLGINYGLGLSNLSPESDYKVKNRVFSFTVGFSF